MPAIRVGGAYQDAEIEDDTILYRITSPLYAAPSILLTGGGGIRHAGRFNRVGQLTSYVSDNPLICISEVLFHMWRVAIEELLQNSYLIFRRLASNKYKLVIFKSRRIQNLVYIDSSQALQYYSLNSSTLIRPDQNYDLLQNAGDAIRHQGHSGIIYPSARHSMGYSVALFGDNSAAIKNIEASLEIFISLASEDLSPMGNLSPFDPVLKKVNGNLGHFSIDQYVFNRHLHFLSPRIPSPQGKIDFHRIHYGSLPYPACAIR